MSETTDQTGKDIAFTIEATGPHPPDDTHPPPATSSSGRGRKNRIKTKQELLDDVILKHAMYKPSSLVSEDATDEEKQADRRRFLNAKATRWRQIFSKWPRDSQGEFLTEHNSQPGKMAPNGIEIWGATLFNLYSVTRIPGFTGLVTFSSGSKLAAWMKANDEDYAKSMLDFAKNEADPELITPYNITGLIQAGDVLTSNKSWVRDKDEGEGFVGKGKGKGKGKEREYWQVPQPWPPQSPFDSRAYSKPWPIEPFARDLIGGTCYPKLQAPIIHSHLPQILKVHDPWNLLRAALDDDDWEEWEKDKKKKWSEKTDVIHDYKLETSTKNTARKTKDDRALEADEARRRGVYDKFISDPHSRNELPSGMIFHQDPTDGKVPGPTKPPIFVLLPFQPPTPPVHEAHLYLSPNDSIGAGNHSFVYSAEFELPRSTIMDDKICHQCLMEELFRTLREEDGPNYDLRDPKWDEKIGRYVMKKIGKPPLLVSLDFNDDVPGAGEEQYLLEADTLQFTLEYDGPFRLFHSKIGYQCLERGPYCDHIAKSQHGIHPLTAKVKIAAKLSIENDHHLSKEAEMYQAFPRHFFEHWSGFNVIKPIKEPVPVGPLVPQFYGYYVLDKAPEQAVEDPEQSNTDESSQSRSRGYLSPILLLEDCGTPVDPETLSLDDQSEAGSLVFRFHDAGWIHGSIAKRNILVQPGPLNDPPPTRDANSRKRDGHGVDWSFRLIDFGRSYETKGLSAHDRNTSIMAEGSTIEKWLFHNQKLN